MGRDLKHERFLNLLLNEIESERNMKCRINNKLFHNHDFLDGYAYGLLVAKDIIIGRKSDGQ
jgi:hypothetical protein